MKSLRCVGSILRKRLGQLATQAWNRAELVIVWPCHNVHHHEAWVDCANACDHAFAELKRVEDEDNSIPNPDLISLKVLCGWSMHQYVRLRVNETFVGLKMVALSDSRFVVLICFRH